MREAGWISQVRDVAPGTRAALRGKQPGHCYSLAILRATDSILNFRLGHYPVYIYLQLDKLQKFRQMIIDAKAALDAIK